MAKTIFIISTSNFATLQKPVFSKRCFVQKHPQPLLILGENLMQNASFQKTLKTTYHSSSVDDTCPKQIYSIRAVHFQVNSWMNSLPDSICSVTHLWLLRPSTDFASAKLTVSTHPVRWLGTNRCTFTGTGCFVCLEASHVPFLEVW